MIIREEYLKKLFTYMNAPIIKILAGIRRCGKSTILEMLHKELISKGFRYSFRLLIPNHICTHLIKCVNSEQLF